MWRINTLGSFQKKKEALGQKKTQNDDLFSFSYLSLLIPLVDSAARFLSYTHFRIMYFSNVSGAIVIIIISIRDAAAPLLIRLFPLSHKFRSLIFYFFFFFFSLSLFFYFYYIMIIVVVVIVAAVIIVFVFLLRFFFSFSSSFV